ncbi:MAG: FHA domain-containing protein [Lachnospiraceae bacterium]|nr:FHA domain-containing protein [Candidatus Equihabitans merdae]
MEYKMITESGNSEAIRIREGINIAGRSDDVDFQLHHPGGSRVHAALFKRNEGCYITDLRSVNGTYVNGQLLPPERTILLQDGDRVTFGDESFLFRGEIEGDRMG